MNEPELTISTSGQPAESATRATGGAAMPPVYVCLLLAIVTLAVFWPVRNFEFINYDDQEYVTSNRHVQDGLTLDGLAWAFTTGHASNWHPLTWVSHMVDASLFGADPAGPHVVNLLFHTVNAMLLFLLLRKLTGAHWRSAFVAALFALHPLHVESVAWVSERKDLLSTLFWLLTLWFYGRYAQERSNAEERTPKAESTPAPNFRLALLFFALGLMSKPMLVTLPFVLLLLDYWPLGRLRFASFSPEKPASISSVISHSLSLLRALVREKLPFFGMAAVSSIVTFWVQKEGGAVDSLAQISLGARIENVFVSYARYLGKTFWPVDLAIPYLHPGKWPAAAVIVSAVFVVGLSLVAAWLGRRRPFVFTGWFWFLGTLVPVIGLVQVGIQSLADRYTYVPLIGVFIILAWGTGEMWNRWRWPGWVAATAAVLILGACAVRTRDQLACWQNTGALFRHTIAVTEDNYRAFDNLGLYLYEQGRINEAIEHYHKALAICAWDSTTLNNLGAALFRQDKLDKAIECYELALRYKTNFAAAHNNLGAALVKEGKTAEAIQHFTEALRLEPENAQAHNNLANRLVAQGKLEEAARHYLLALEANPNFLEALNNLGLILADRGQYNEAIQCFQNALQLAPKDEVLHKDLGDIFAKAGRNDEAVAEYTEALRLKPDFTEAEQQLKALTGKSPNPAP